MLVYAHDGFGNPVGRNALDHGYERSLPSAAGTVGHDGVQLAVAQSRLVYANARPDVVSKDKPLVCMVELVPTAETAEVILVLPFESIGLNVVVLLKRTAGHWGTLHTYLLKKPRTPWSNTFPRQRGSMGDRSSRRPCG